MIKFHILASGSKGNCCVVQTNYATILIDCGYKIRYLKQHLAMYDNFDAMIITHDHIDHIAQLKYFENYPIITASDIQANDVTKVKPFDEIHIKDLKITILPLSHDSENTIGILFTCNNESFVYICDTGYVSQKVQSMIQNKTYYMIESNHDIEMLMQSNRSMYLKQRILSDTGHLSNDACAEILQNVVGKNTKQVVLGHLSQDCNHEEIAFKTAKKVLANHVVLKIAKQDESVFGGAND